MILLIILLIHCAFMSLAWFIRFKTGQSGWVDAIWSLSVGVSGCVAAWAPFQFSSLSARQWIVEAPKFNIAASNQFNLLVVVLAFDNVLTFQQHFFVGDFQQLVGRCHIASRFAL